MLAVNWREGIRFEILPPLPRFSPTISPFPSASACRALRLPIMSTELHIAVKLDEPDVVRNLLEQQLCNIHAIDENGDQAAHLAARLNRIGCMQVLIEFDAKMGRKNFNSLTPLGEAQMHGHREIATLIKNNYTTDQSHSYIWDEEVRDECATWFDSYDDERQALQWVRVGPNGEVEISRTPPPMDVQRVIDAREKYGERNVVRRLHPGSLPSQQQLEYERKKELEKQALAALLKSRSAIVEERCAIKLQSHFRKIQAAQLARLRQMESIASRRIQRRYRFYRNRKRNRAVIRIQSVLRMYFALSYYKSVLHERLWWFRASRILANTGQRLWRGFKGRSISRRIYEMKHLPSPADIRNHDFWEKLQHEAHPPTKELGIYCEYTLSGHPRTWAERNLVKRNGMYRDVAFYANTITKRATWSKPRGWQFKDHREYYVLRLQTFWRARVAKRKIRILVKAKTLLENAHSKELENTKQGITTLCNFALYAHAILHDYDTARSSYAKILAFMNDRGVDNAFVLYSYAIFGAVTNEEDWNEINDLIRRGKVAEDLMQKRRATEPAPGEPKSVYAIARAAFYLQAVGNDDDPAESWHNYALCQMLVYQDFEGARESFRRAMMASLHPSCVAKDQDRRIISNFNALLQHSEFLGLYTNAHEEYLAIVEGKISLSSNTFHNIF